MTHVFVYGSLQCPEVLMTLLNRVPSLVPAILPDFKRYSVKDQSYPMIARSPGSSVHGLILLSLTPTEIEILDAFEGEEYEKTPVTVFNQVTGSNEHVFAYVGHILHQHLLVDKEWDLEHFRMHHLDRFLKMCRHFIAN